MPTIGLPRHQGGGIPVTGEVAEGEQSPEGGQHPVALPVGGGGDADGLAVGVGRVARGRRWGRGGGGPARHVLLGRAVVLGVDGGARRRSPTGGCRPPPGRRSGPCRPRPGCTGRSGTAGNRSCRSRSRRGRTRRPCRRSRRRRTPNPPPHPVSHWHVALQSM